MDFGGKYIAISINLNIHSNITLPTAHLCNLWILFVFCNFATQQAAILVTRIINVFLIHRHLFRWLRRCWLSDNRWLCFCFWGSSDYWRWRRLFWQCHWTYFVLNDWLRFGCDFRNWFGFNLRLDRLWFWLRFLHRFWLSNFNRQDF